ncbi:MAG: polymer-forming cytoskeletal protein [Actinomycetota bacterium]|nr:polymer-forming cytoskeletal protein [Actinomycetota bacterium]
MSSGLLRMGSAWLALLAVAMMLLSGAALAQEVLLGGKVLAAEEVVVPAGQTVPHDLYVSAGRVRIEGRVRGDLVAAGGDLDVSGEVTGDLLAAGGTTTISGEIGGDARVASGQVLVGGSVGEDLLLASGRATIAPEAQVAEDLIFATGQMTLDGTVDGDVLGTTGSYQKRGSVGGTEQVTIREPAEERPPTALQRLLDGVLRYLGILLVGALFLWFAPRIMIAGAASLRRRLLASLGLGILAIVGFFVLVLAVVLVTVLLAVALGLLGFGALTLAAIFAGILVAALTSFLFFLAVAFLAQAVVALVLGRLVVGERAGSFWRHLIALALGLLVVVLVSAIPLVGSWLEFLIVLFGLGALVLGVAARDREPVPEHVG